METSIAVCRGKEIRKTIHDDEWWFSIADVVEVLTDSTDPRQYIKNCADTEGIFRVIQSIPSARRRRCQHGRNTRI